MTIQVHDFGTALEDSKKNQLYVSSNIEGQHQSNSPNCFDMFRLIAILQVKQKDLHVTDTDDIFFTTKCLRSLPGSK